MYISESALPPLHKNSGGHGKKVRSGGTIRPYPQIIHKVTAHIHVSVSCRTKPGRDMDGTWTEHGRTHRQGPILCLARFTEPLPDND